MSRRKIQPPREDPEDLNRRSIYKACEELRKGPLVGLLDSVTVQVVASRSNAPDHGALDAHAGVIHLNPFQSGDRGDRTWQRTIAHLLLHAGFNHAARREERNPWLWNIACDQFVDNLLASLFGFSGQVDLNAEREERIYVRLEEEWKARGETGRYHYRTEAGPNRCDLLNLDRVHLWNRNWDRALGEGIRLALEQTVQEIAHLAGIESEEVWGPIGRARRWVMNELPLLGALAAQITIVSDARICDQMDIPIAAVNGHLGEMYINPSWHMSEAEWIFLFAHELLHVALLHHSRLRGRDPLVWNFACDFVINGWLVEMGVGRLPSIGGLYDPRLQGMGAEEVYDLLMREPKRRKGLRGFRGGLPDVLFDHPGRSIYRGDVSTLDDVWKRCLQSGMEMMGPGRGTMPAGLLEEIKALFSPPPPWDVELARWMEQHVPLIRDPLRSYARASRRQASTPDIPRPARYVPQEWKDACTFGVVLDTSGSMDRELLGRALGAIASYAEARDVPAVRLILCDAAPYDHGYIAPTQLRGRYPVVGRGGTELQPAVNYLLARPDFPPRAPIMLITDGWCEEEVVVPRDHCFVLPRKGWKEGAMPLRTSAPIFRVLKESHED